MNTALLTGQKAFKELLSSQNDVVSVLESLTVHYDNLAKGSQGSHKPLSEYKGVNNLKVLGSNKSDFQSWNGKFINAIAQGAGAPWRKFMNNLDKKLDQDRRTLTAQELDNIEGAEDITNKKDANEELYYVLVEETEGEAALRVNSGEPGEGIQAYMRVYLWFSGTSGQA